jgi:enterochelin esterase-like enzyme
MRHIEPAADGEEIDVSGGRSSTLLPTRTLRDVFRAKGHHVRYRELTGGHDYLSWRVPRAERPI